MVTALDAAIGRVVEALKKKGLYDDTIFFFTPDVSQDIFSFCSRNQSRYFNMSTCIRDIRSPYMHIVRKIRR
jgi:arylsulfatase A-like enzyme